MVLKDFVNALPEAERIKFAERCGTTLGHLRNVMYEYKPASVELAVAIERESGAEVLCHELLDGFWVRIPDADWPSALGRPLHDADKVTA